MKLATFDGTPFAMALESLLGTLIAGHPDKEQILADVTAGRVALRVTVDQALNLLTIGAREDGEQRLVATVDMSAGSSSWQVVYPDWNAPAGPIDATVH